MDPFLHLLGTTMLFSLYRGMGFLYKERYDQPLYLANLHNKDFLTDEREMKNTPFKVIVARNRNFYYRMNRLYLYVKHPFVFSKKFLKTNYYRLKEQFYLSTFYLNYIKVWPEGTYQNYLHTHRLKAVKGLECSICLEEFE